VLDLDARKRGKSGADPLPVEGVRLLLLDAVVAVDLEALAVLAGQSGSGGVSRKPPKSAGKWPWKTISG
jgi:hypothetical protein